MLPGVEAKHKKLMVESRVFPKEVRAQFEFLPQIKKFAANSATKETPEPATTKTTKKKKSAVAAKKNILDNLSPEIVYGSFDEDGSGIIVLMDLNDKGMYARYNGGLGMVGSYCCCSSLCRLLPIVPLQWFQLGSDRRDCGQAGRVPRRRIRPPPRQQKQQQHLQQHQHQQW